MTGADGEFRRLLAEGNALEDAGQYAAARQRYEAAARLDPASPRPLLNAGNAFAREGSLPDAVAVTRRAVAVAPGFAPAHYNLGLLLQRAGDADEAERALRNACHLDPAFADAAVALANLLQGTGRMPAARAELERALAASPAHAGVACALGIACLERDELDRAETLLAQALAANPGIGAACGALGDLCFRTGRAREAEGWYRRALALDPRARDVAMALLFSLTARDDLSPGEIFAAHCALAPMFEGPAPAASPETRPARARVRVGYLSPDFRAHAVALFIGTVLRHHDRSGFDVHCYDCDGSRSPVNDALRPLADRWRNIAGLSDADAAATIRRDDLDILVDLAGYTHGSRIAVFGMRCARVQATWLGYLHSTGLRSADLRICDGHTDPPGLTEHLHTERLARLPHSLWCYEPIHRTGDAAPVVRAGQQVVFASFNQFWKIGDRRLALWLAILRDVPDAGLKVIGVPGGRTMDRFRARLVAGGVDAGRIVLLPRLDVASYFEAIAASDIALDTAPYNGATTTLDALSQGVPLVALEGDRSVSRSGVSILRSAGVPQLVAKSESDYVDLNVRLARDHAWRHGLRASLPARLQASPLMDGATFTRDLEALYRRALDERGPPGGGADGCARRE